MARTVGVSFQPVVANKTGNRGRSTSESRGTCQWRDNYRSATLSTASTLLLHKLFETGLINLDVFSTQNIFGQVQGKAVGVIEAKGDVAGKDAFFVLLKFRSGIFEQEPTLFPGFLRNVLPRSESLRGSAALPCGAQDRHRP